MPLEGVNGVLGVLTLYHAERDAFTKDHLRILLAISSKIALSIENALRFRQAESSATTDYLTNLPNARSLFLQLDSELSRGTRSELPLAVLVLDLDGFKQVNDRFGHLEGNKVLRAVAAGLEIGVPRVRLRGAHGRRRIRGAAAGRQSAGRRGEDRAIPRRGEAGRPRDLFAAAHLTASIGVAHFPGMAPTRSSFWRRRTGGCTKRSAPTRTRQWATPVGKPIGPALSTKRVEANWPGLVWTGILRARRSKERKMA